MQKFNVIKTWSIDGKKQMSFIDNAKGITYNQAVFLLNETYNLECCRLFQDIEPIVYDNDTILQPYFTVIRNNVKFIYKIEVDQFTEMSEYFKPKTKVELNPHWN